MRRKLRPVVFAIALLGLASLACRCGVSPTIGPKTFAEYGAETWTIDGTDYAITRSYVISFPEGAQYTVEWDCNCPDELRGIDEAAAQELAAPLFRYAVESGAWVRWHLAGAKPNKVGIEISATTASGRSGYRTSREVAEILSDIKAKPSPTP